MDQCIFCKIAQGQIPAPKVIESDRAFVIRDIQPQAAKHFLVIPKHHVATLEEAFVRDQDGRALVADLFSLASELARKEGLLPGGYRSVINTHADAGQTVFHVHLHILGGERLKGTFA